MLGYSLSLTMARMKPQMLQEVQPKRKLSKLVFAYRASLEGATPEDRSHFSDSGNLWGRNPISES